MKSNKFKHIFKSFGFKKLFWCLFMIAIVIVTIISIFPNNDTVKINSEETQSFNEHWMLENTREEINLPYVLDTKENETVVIAKVLPHVFEQSNPTLSFHSSLQSVILSVDDNVIYTYNQKPDAYFDVQPPSAWHVVRLDKSTEGQTIRFEYNSPFKGYSGVLHDIELGTKYANVSSFMASRIVSIGICIIIFAFGLFAIIICLFAHNKVTHINPLLYLGVAALLIACWSVCETKAMQIVTGNVQAIMFITFLSIMLFPIPLLLYFRENFTGVTRKLYNLLIATFSLYFIIAVILQIFSIANFNDGFILLLALLALMLVLITTSLIRAYRINKTSQNRLPVIAVSTLLVFAVIDLYRNLFMNLMQTSYSDTSLFIRIGILAMLFILGYASIQHILEYYSEAKLYKVLSLTDSLTGLKNRAYLHEVYPSVFQDAITHKVQFSVIMVDIDNFKEYNDHYGHLAGDEVIREVSIILQSVARSSNGSAIRYGGEEFIIVLPHIEYKEVINAAKNIKRELDEKIILHAYSSVAPIITLSQGIHSAIPAQKDTLELFIDYSDQAMYDVKKKKKNGYGIYNANKVMGEQ